MKIQALVALLLHHCHSASSRPLQETEYTLHEFRDFNGKSQFSLTSRGDGKFSGSLSAPLGTSTFDSITAKKGIEVNGEINTKKLIASNAIEGQSIKVAKSIHAESAKFESSVTVGDSITTKDGIVKGVLNVTSGFSSKGPIYAKSVSVVGLVEAKSMEASDFIKANKLNVAKDIVAGGKVVSDEGFFSREGTIKIKEVESNKLKVMEHIDAVSADFRGEVSISKKLQVKDTIDANSVSISNRLDVSANGGVTIEGSLSCKGQASFANGFEANGDVTMKRVLVSQIIKAPIIDASKGSILVDQLKVNDGIKTDSLISGAISAKELQVAGPSSFGDIDSNVIKTKSLEANTILANMTSIAEKLVAKTIETTNISISENLFATGAVLVSGNLSSSSISASSLRVNGKVNVSESLSANDITAMGSFLTMGNATINEGLDVKGDITGSSIFVGDLAVGGPLERSRLGCMSVSSKSGVDIEGSLSVGQNTIMNQSLSVRERINATDISAQELIVDRLFSNELLVSGPVNATNVTSSDGFFSDGDMMIGHVTAAGNISVHGEIATPVLRATDVLLAKQASVDNLNVQSNLKVGNATYFKGEVEFSSGAIFHDNANFTGDLVSMNKLIVRAAEIQNGLEVGSLFTKRVYAQDIAATGFVTAASIMSKGDVNVTGTVNTFGLAAVNVNVKDVYVSNELRCSTARIEGVLDSAGITAQKVSVKGDLVVKGMDVINAIEKLEKRIIDLEQMLATLHSQK